MLLEIQKYLLGHSDIEARLTELKTTTGISHKRHIKYPNLILFKYNQILSPMKEKIVQEARGIILDQNNAWHIVSRTFDKFFNHGEGHAATIDWATARVQEKLDGSLCQVSYYSGQFSVASSGTPDALGNVNNKNQTFATYFWDTFHKGGYGFTEEAINYTFAFELMGPINRIIVVHNEPHICLIGARDMRTQNEISVDEASKLLTGNVPIVKSFPLQSYADITSSFEKMSPLSQEGYVVVDANFNRVKVKHPGYVALHHAKDGMTTKAFIEIARKGEICEVITAFPEFQPLLIKAKTTITTFAEKLQYDFDVIKHITDQKAFALSAAKTKYPNAMFSIREGKIKSIVNTKKIVIPITNAVDYIANMRLDILIDNLGI